MSKDPAVALGATHVLAKATGSLMLPRFAMHMTIHVEDMYNFNPGAADIATGIADAANGVFEVTGLAQQYMNVATLDRSVSWVGSAATPAQVTTSDQSRQRKPADNRRARNRT